ncbi:MAG: hypothetical protein HC888_06770 [Candidatus Competibacteraceae bacterium]|nr:hypothetical protein [Candidatus Competibacteraceae bacterium]
MPKASTPTSRRTDDEVYRQYLERLGNTTEAVPNPFVGLMMELIADARREEPKINHGDHIYLWQEMDVEDGDNPVTMDEYYGEGNINWDL